MNPKAQRIAIAEACGWKHLSEKERIPVGLNRGYYYAIDPEGCPRFTIPDYPSDLNAMHEAEASLEPYEWQEYPMQLRRIIQRDCDKPECYVPGTERSQLISDFWFYHATAAQRAEAFLKTKGLWKEGV